MSKPVSNLITKFYTILILKILPIHKKFYSSLNIEMYYVEPSFFITPELAYNLSFFFKIMFDNFDNSFTFIAVMSTVITILLTVVAAIALILINRYFLLNIKLISLKTFVLLFLCFLLLLYKSILFTFLLIKIKYVPVEITDSLIYLQTEIASGYVSNLEDLSRSLDAIENGDKIKEAFSFIELCHSYNLSVEQNLPFRYKEILTYGIIIDCYTNIKN